MTELGEDMYVVKMYTFPPQKWDGGYNVRQAFNMNK